MGIYDQPDQFNTEPPQTKNGYDGRNLTQEAAAGEADRARKDAEAAAAAAKRQEYLNHFNYGGQAGGAAQQAGYYGGQAQGAQGRMGEQINYDLAYSYGDAARNNGGDQRGIAEMMRARANGTTPSIAQMQADRQMRQASAEQSSMAASARGPAAMALAQQQQAGNVAGLQSNISNQAQINGAQERMQAEQNAFGAFTNMRGQDIQGMQTAADMAQKQAAINAAQRAQNDQYGMGMYGLQNDVNKAQLAAQQNQIGIETGAITAANNLAGQKSMASDARTDGWLKAGFGAVGTGTALYFGSMLGGGGSDPIPGTSGPSFGNSDYGAPGTTPGGYDSAGAPVAGSGGGFDPDSDPSDVTAKQNISPLAYGMGANIFGPEAAADPYAAQGLMLSDTRAKKDAYELRTREAQASAWDEGRAAAMKDMQRLGGMGAQQLKAYGDSDMAGAVRGMRASAWDEGNAAPRPQPAPQVGGQEMAQMQGLMAQGASVRDPVTDQFARGLAPSAYDYKPGIPGATPGRKVGPMAQNMAANPITGTAVRVSPQSGMLAIDNKDGLKVALGGVGHLAQKQQQTDARLQEALAKIEAATSGQREGLLGMGPSVGQQYLDYVRGTPMRLGGQ